MKISLKFVLKVPIYNISAWVQIMAWHRPGTNPLYEQVMVSLLTICHLVSMMPACTLKTESRYDANFVVTCDIMTMTSQQLSVFHRICTRAALGHYWVCWCLNTWPCSAISLHHWEYKMHRIHYGIKNVSIILDAPGNVQNATAEIFQTFVVLLP